MKEGMSRDREYSISNFNYLEQKLGTQLGVPVFVHLLLFSFISHTMCLELLNNAIITLSLLSSPLL